MKKRIDKSNSDGYNDTMYIGMDLHKNFLQIAMMDNNGNILKNSRIENNHVRYQKDSNITRFYNRIAARRGKAKATVAAASKMLRVMYWMLKERREYQHCS